MCYLATDNGNIYISYIKSMRFTLVYVTLTHQFSQKFAERQATINVPQEGLNVPQEEHLFFNTSQQKAKIASRFVQDMLRSISIF